MLFASDSNPGGSGTRTHLDVAIRGSYLILVGTRLSTSEALYHNLAEWDPGRAQLRWRATNPGTRSATRFTRNWTVETS